MLRRLRATIAAVVYLLRCIFERETCPPTTPTGTAPPREPPDRSP